MHELFNKYTRWSRSRAKVTAPAPAKYPGSGRLRLRNPGTDSSRNKKTNFIKRIRSHKKWLHLHDEFAFCLTFLKCILICWATFLSVFCFSRTGIIKFWSAVWCSVFVSQVNTLALALHLFHVFLS